MLVLTRKFNEKIVINGNITVTVVRLEQNQVRIGIDAPAHMTINRQEIEDEIGRDGRRLRE